MVRVFFVSRAGPASLVDGIVRVRVRVFGVVGFGELFGDHEFDFEGVVYGDIVAGGVGTGARGAVTSGHDWGCCIDVVNMRYRCGGLMILVVLLGSE